MAELYRTIENPLVRVLARMEHAGIAVDVAELRQLNERLTADVAAPRRRAEGGRRARRPQHQLADPAARDPLRRAAGRARADADQEDEDRRVHRRGDAGEAARRVARVHRPAAAVPRGREAARHVRRGAARRGRRRTGGSTPRSTRPSPAPGGSARTARTCTTSRCAGRRAGCSARRSSPRPGGKLLVADYNQIELRCIAHLAADPGLVAAFTRRRGHPQRHGGADLRRRPGRRHARPAVEGEDGVVRAGLRHGGVRARPAAEHPDRGGGDDPRRLLRGLPQREGVHGLDGRRGPQAGLHRDAVRAPPADPRAAQRQLADPPGRRAPGDERRHPGPRRRHLQGRPGAHRRGARGARSWRAASCCRCTTRSSSRCPSTSARSSARSSST